MLLTSTVSGARTRYTCGGGRKGRDGRRGNCCCTQQLLSNPHFLHWWNVPSDCFYYLRKKVPIQNPVVLKWSFYRHKKIFPYPSVWFLLLRPGYSNRLFAEYHALESDTSFLFLVLEIKYPTNLPHKAMGMQTEAGLAVGQCKRELNFILYPSQGILCWQWPITELNVLYGPQWVCLS